MDYKEKAQELMDSLHNLAYANTHDVSVVFDYHYKRSKIAISLIITQEVLKEIPMYQGALNPKWEFWTRVANHLLELNEENESWYVLKETKDLVRQQLKLKE